MLITPIRAAGLLLILASIASGEPDIDAPAEQMDPADLLRTFQRRANVKRHMAESRKRSYWPLRSRSRRSQTGSDVNKEKTFNPEKAPPRFFHASKFATADTNATQPVNGSNSTAPLVDSQDGKPFFRSGRTSQSGSRFRPPNPLLSGDESGNDPRVQEFRIQTSDTGDLLDPSGEERSQTGYFSIGEDGLQVASSGELSQRDLPSQRFLGLATTQAGGGRTEAAPTWQGQPSKFRPKQPYQPSMNSTTASTGYADVISKSLWFYQVQSRYRGT